MKPALYPSRQRFTLPLAEGEKKATVLGNGKKLSDYGLREGSKVVFKDLGPQVNFCRSTPSQGIARLERGCVFVLLASGHACITQLDLRRPLPCFDRRRSGSLPASISILFREGRLFVEICPVTLTQISCCIGWLFHCVLLGVLWAHLGIRHLLLPTTDLLSLGQVSAPAGCLMTVTDSSVQSIF